MTQYQPGDRLRIRPDWVPRLTKLITYTWSNIPVAHLQERGRQLYEAELALAQGHPCVVNKIEEANGDGQLLLVVIGKTEYPLPIGASWFEPVLAE